MYKNQIIIDGLQYCKSDRSYFESLKDAGITAVHVTLVYHEDARQTLSAFAKWNRLFEQNADLIMPVMNADDIAYAKKNNLVGIFFGAQNCSPIDCEIGMIEIMRKLGLLIMQLTYNNQSLLATGCYENVDSGITRFGKQAIEEMNRVGMIIDMSHSAQKSTIEAIHISSRPICISHANPLFAHNGLRNKSNEVLKALAKKGGLLGFSLYPFHLPNKNGCTLDNFCQMVAKTADLIGIDSLGIGSDLCLNQPKSVLEWMRNGTWSKSMDYGEGDVNNSDWPDNLSWFQSPKDMEAIYLGLKKYGFNQEEVNKIMGKNWFEFLKKGLIKLT